MSAHRTEFFGRIAPAAMARHSYFNTLTSSVRAWFTASLLLLVSSFVSTVQGQTLIYWDTNGATRSTGVAGGTWDPSTNATWTSENGGERATVTWNSLATGANSVAVFSAGSDGIGTWSVATSGAINNVGGIRFTEGNVTISSGATLNLSQNATISTNTPGSSTIAATLAGAFTVTKDGAHTLVLSGNNSYTGLTTISAGTLKLGGAGSGANTPLGTVAAGTTVSSGAALDLNGFTLVTAEALTLNGTGVSSGGALTNSSGSAATYSGLVTLGSTSSIEATSGNILLTNAGTITGSGFGLTLGGAATGSSISSIIGTGAGTVTKTGNGTWTLSGANTYTGLTTVSAGTLKVGSTAALGTNASGTTVASGGALELNGFTLSSAEALTLSGTGISSTGALINSGAAVSYSGAITLGAVSPSIGGTGNITVSGAIASGATSDLTKVGTNTLTLSGTNTYTGITTVSSGVLALGSTTALGGVPSATPGSAVTSGTVVTSGAALELNGITLTNPEALSLSGTGITSTGALINSGVAATFSGGITLGSVAPSIGGTGNITITGMITNGATGDLTKVGTNTLTLSGTNTYTGNTTVSAGTLRLGSNSALGASPRGGNTTVTSVTSGATLDLNGISHATNEALTLSGLGVGSLGALYNSVATAVSFGGPITLGAVAPSIGGISGGNITLLGAISDGTTTTFTKTGANTLTIIATQASTYTGTTNVSQGMLSIAQNYYPGDPKPDVLGSVAGGTVVSNNASLELRPGTIANSTLVVGNEALTISGTGTATNGALRNLAGSNTYGGLITLGATSSIQSDAGTLNLTNTGTINGATFGLTLTGAGNGSLASIIGTTTGTLTKSGTGTWALTGVNTYTGGTSVTGGLLEFSAANNFGGGTNNVTLNGGGLRWASGTTTDISSRLAAIGTSGATFNTNNNNVTFATVLTGGTGALTKSGLGNLTLANGNNVYTGTTTVNGGTLTINGNAGRIGSTTGTTTVTGGTLTIGDTTAGNGLANRINTAASLTLGGTSGGGTFNLLRGSTTTGNQQLAALNVANGVSSFTGGASAANTAPNLTLSNAAASNYTRAVGGLLNVTNANASLIFTNIPSTPAAIAGTAGDLILRGMTLNGTDFVKPNAGAVISAATYTAGTGATWTAAKNMNVTGNVSAAGANVNSVRFNTAGAFTVTQTSGTSNIASGMILVGSGVGANLSKITGGNISGPVSSDLMLINNNASGNLEIASVIINNTATSLTNAGSGVSILSGANTYTGGTLLQAGTLKMSGTGTLGITSGLLTINTGATLDLNNTSQSVGNFTGSGGTVTSSTAGTVTLTIGTGNGTGGNFQGIIQNGSGTVGLTKTGTGTIALSGANTYTGGTTISNGVLEVRSQGALSTGTVLVSNGAQLSLNAADLVLGTNTSTISLNGTGGGTGALINGYTTAGGTTAQVNNSIALVTSSTINSGTTAGNILQLGKMGAYSFASSPGTITEYSTIDLGANTLTFTGSANTFTQIEGKIFGTGNVIVNTSGTVNYYDPRNTYTGTTTVQNGTLLVDTASNPGAPNDPTYTKYFGITGPLVIGDGTGGNATAIVRLGNGISQGTTSEVIKNDAPITLNSDGLLLLNSNPQTIGALTMTGGRIDGSVSGLYLDVANTAVTITPTSTSGPSIIDGKLSLTYNLWSPSETAIRQNRTFNVGYDAANVATGDLIINANVTQGSLTKSGLGTLVLASAANDYDGTTTINAGTLNVQVGTNGSDKSSLGLSGGGSGQDTTVNSGGTLQLQGGIAITKEGLTLAGSGANSRGALESLSGDNTWGTVSTGQIVLSGNATIGVTSGSLTIPTTFSSSGGPFGLTILGAGNTTISGGINTGTTSAATLTKQGNGTLTLSGASNFYGATDIQSGIVVLANAAALGNTAAGTTVANGAELRLTGGILFNSEALTLNGTGIGASDGALRNFSGSNTYSGAITVGAANTRINSDTGTLSLTGALSSSNLALVMGGSGNINSSGMFGLGTGTLTKDGTGTVTFSGLSTTAGNTTVNAGTLAFNGPATLDQVHLLNSSAITVGGSSTLTTNQFDSSSLSTLTIGGGSTVVANYTSGSTTFSGQLAGTGTFKALGAGTVVFDQSINASGLTVYIGGSSVGTNASPLTFSITNNAHLTFGTLRITGDTILDFGNSSASFLSSTTLTVDANVLITVNNWVSMVDAWYATTTFTGGTLDRLGSTPENQITFNGFSNNSTSWVTIPTYGYREHEIRPVPEPSTYGAIFVSGALGLIAFRRYRRQSAAKTAPAPQAD